MLVGIARATITPPLGTPLAGYGGRERPAESVLDDLEVRAFWFEVEDAGGAACLVTADLIGFGGEMARAIRAEIAARTALPDHAIMLAASHTHSGPQTLTGLEAAGGAPVPSYLASLQSAVACAVCEAREARRPALITVGRGRVTGFAINRRVARGSDAEMRPNPDAPRDDEVTVVSFVDAAAGRIMGGLFHYTCHPTTMGDLRVTGDYPGSARRHAEAALDGAAYGFLPGCFGDVRPNCTLLGGKTFRSGGPDDVHEYGAALGAEIARVAREEPRRVSPKLLARMVTVDLPLEKEPLTAPLPLQRLDLSDQITLIAMGGEMCVDYGLYIKSLRPDAAMIPMGYTNDVITYVASERMFPEGGYEVNGAWPWFGQPSAFKPSVERVLQAAIQDILRA